jgi:hypothetical protein
MTAPVCTLGPTLPEDWAGEVGEVAEVVGEAAGAVVGAVDGLTVGPTPAMGLEELATEFTAAQISLLMVKTSAVDG